MANNTNSAEHFVELYEIRTGLKREFAFAMKAQSQICGSLGRTRSKKAQTLVELSNDSSHKLCEKSRQQKIQNLTNLAKTKEDTSVALSEKEVNSDVMDVEKLKSQMSDETRMLVICEKEHKSDEPKTQLEDKGVMIVVCDEEHNNDEPKTEIGQNQPACDNDIIKEEDVNDEIVSTLDYKLKNPIESIQSTLQKLENGDSKVESNGIEKERKNVSMIVASTPVTSSMRFMGKKFPSKLKDFLSSGILEGLLVKYIRSIKVLFY